MTGMTRRDLIQSIVGFSVLLYTVAYAVPIAIEEMFQAAPRGLEIQSDTTHTIEADTTESYTYVTWLGSGAQLEFNSGSQLRFKT